MFDFFIRLIFSLFLRELLRLLSAIYYVLFVYAIILLSFDILYIDPIWIYPVFQITGKILQGLKSLQASLLIWLCESSSKHLGSALLIGLHALNGSTSWLHSCDRSEKLTFLSVFSETSRPIIRYWECYCSTFSRLMQ